MSASYSSSLCYGILFEKNDLTTSIPHPLYGKFKFDPDTGIKVSEYIENHIDMEKEASNVGLDVCYTTDCDYMVVGKSYGSFSIGEGGDEYSRVRELPSPELTEKIIAFAKSLGFVNEAPSIYALGYCSN